jgi:catabolite regulation protein CreA
MADNVNQRVIAEMPGSGFFLKDTLRIESFNDPKVDGVQLYISDFQKPMTEKIAKGDVFQDPTLAGLTCSNRARVVVHPDAMLSTEGEEVFSEARSLLFKSLKVRRIVDKQGQTVVYVLYSQKLDKYARSCTPTHNALRCKPGSPLTNSLSPPPALHLPHTNLALQVRIAGTAHPRPHPLTSAPILTPHASTRLTSLAFDSFPQKRRPVRIQIQVVAVRCPRR